MKKQLLLLLLLLTCLPTQASEVNDRKLIISTLNNYLEGTSYNNQQQINTAFHQDAKLYLEKKSQPLWIVPALEYASWFKEENLGQFNGRIGEILAIDVSNNIATAKVEILIPEANSRFIDLFLLKKLDNRWQIISKSATKLESNRSGNRILFIVSSAHFHGKSTLPAGVSFSEIVNAYETFLTAGYTVDFVSPDGGAIPLSYINTSMPIHKKYLYSADFMHAIANTKKPTEIKPENYKAVHYIGGSNAMYGVANNEALQKITMTIYEEYNGIISAVCHGTAGIVNLKTKAGNYLVANKRISGYPESYENQSRAYFKEFPFLIQQTIEQRKGKFFHGERNQPHVEVDGRVVTGQNHLSSALVAQRIIEILAKG